MFKTLQNWFGSKKSYRPAVQKRPSFRPTLECFEDRLLPSTVSIPINAQVLAFAQAHVNKIVGDGQCATLAQDAVQSAGGVPFYQQGPTGLNANYVWGKYVTTLTPSNGNTSLIKPGDILQFRNVTEVDTMTINYYNGQSTSWISNQTLSHHTAIVSSVGGNAKYDLEILQANVKLSANESITAQEEVQGGDVWGGKSTVTTNYPQYKFSITVTHTMTGGTIQVYQPYKVVSIS